MRCGSLRRTHHPEVPMHHLHRHRSRRHFLRACAATAAIAHPVIGMAQGLAAQTTIHYGGPARPGPHPAYSSLQTPPHPAAGWAGGRAAQPPTHYGGPAWRGHYPAYLALKSGALPAASIDLRWQSFGTSSARMSAVLSGGIDIACTGIVSALALMARGSRHFAIIAVPEDFGRVEGLFVRSDVSAIAHLRGKKIGVTFASSAHLLVLDLLAGAGLGPAEVAVLNV